jgi:hypothetical protein
MISLTCSHEYTCSYELGAFGRDVTLMAPPQPTPAFLKRMASLQLILSSLWQFSTGTTKLELLTEEGGAERGPGIPLNRREQAKYITA